MKTLKLTFPTSAFIAPRKFPSFLFRSALKRDNSNYRHTRKRDAFYDNSNCLSIFPIFLFYVSGWTRRPRHCQESEVCGQIQKRWSRETVGPNQTKVRNLMTYVIMWLSTRSRISLRIWKPYKIGVAQSIVRLKNICCSYPAKSLEVWHRIYSSIYVFHYCLRFRKRCHLNIEHRRSKLCTTSLDKKELHPTKYFKLQPETVTRVTWCMSGMVKSLL